MAQAARYFIGFFAQQVAKRLVGAHNAKVAVVNADRVDHVIKMRTPRLAQAVVAVSVARGAGRSWLVFGGRGHWCGSFRCLGMARNA